MADKNPWAKWFFSDWRADQCLRSCSLAARGLWKELLCIMHEADPYGHLLINGKAINARQIANQVGGGAGVREIENLMQELREAGVFSETAEGVAFCRRMVRDRQKAEEDRANGRKGGNPQLKGGVNPPGNGTDNPGDKAQKPEARSQEPKKDPRKPPEGGKRKRKDIEYSHAFQQFMAVFPSRGDARNPWPPAYKAWLAAIERGGLPEELIAAARLYAKNESAGTKFSAQAATWLNQDDWKPKPTVAVDAEKPAEPPPDLKGWRLAFWRNEGPTAYQSWIAGAEVSRSAEGGIVTMLQPTRFRSDHVRSNFADKLLRWMKADDPTIALLKVDVKPAKTEPKQADGEQVA